MTFDELARLLTVEGFEETPSELHGLLCGRIAGGERLAGEKFRSAMLDSFHSEEELVDNALAELESFYKEVVATFEDVAFVFHPLLPPDSDALEDRALALADWCHSFLSGLGEAGLSASTELSEDASDAIKDIAAIAQLTLEGESEEDDESDFFELGEYVRVAAMLIYAELNDRPQGALPKSRTIH